MGMQKGDSWTVSKGKKIMIGLFIGLLILANCDWISFAKEEPLRVPEWPACAFLETSDWQGEREAGEISPYRPGYQMGSCQRLSGNIATVTLFVDSGRNKWTEKEAQRYYRKVIAPGFQFLEDKARQRDMDLHFDNWQLISTEDDELYLSSSEIIITGDFDKISTQEGLFDRFARSLAFQGEYEMNAYFERLFDVDQVVYILVLNKPGRAFAYQDNGDPSQDWIEFCTLYTKSSDGFIVSPRTLAHEVLHLFGAEDYYDPNGDKPERKKLAEQVCPNDIMLRNMNDIRLHEVSDITAYTVGWLQQAPDTVKDPLWFQ